MAGYKETLENIETSITEHVRANKDERTIVTGWVLVASVSHPNSIDSDGYVLQASQSLPHHTQVGLLSMALQDKNNISIVSTLRALMGDD